MISAPFAGGRYPIPLRISAGQAGIGSGIGSDTRLRADTPADTHRESA